MTRKQVLYMKVTKDKYELPIAVATSKMELARMTGKSTATIYRGFDARKKEYVAVEIELEEGELI